MWNRIYREKFHYEGKLDDFKEIFLGVYIAFILVTATFVYNKKSPAYNTQKLSKSVALLE